MCSVVHFWYNFVSFRREISKTPERHSESCLQPMAPEKELVFTHHNLAPRNITLESGNGKLWLVDWDLAGFYPSYFEHAAMYNFIPPPEWSWHMVEEILCLDRNRLVLGQGGNAG